MCLTCFSISFNCSLEIFVKNIFFKNKSSNKKSSNKENFKNMSSGMHWIKLGLEVLKHAWKSFPLLMRTDVWGQHLLALGPSRDIPGSFCLETAI